MGERRMSADTAAKALSLQWAFGFSSEVRGGVGDLSTSGRNALCYPSGHTAVIYDLTTHLQTVLQGHRHAITCLAVSPDKSTIATADAGENAILVLWDAQTGEPRWMIPQTRTEGLRALDFSADGSMLATLSAAGGAQEVQELSIWELHHMGIGPVITAPVPAGDIQVCVRFSTDDPGELVTNGPQRVYFWRHHRLPDGSASPGGTRGRMHWYCPPLSVRDLKQLITAFTASVFVPGTARATTATVDGDLVVWEERYGEVGQKVGLAERRAVKILRIHHTAITTLTVVERFVVSGGADGYVRFFDSKFRLCAWFEELDAGEVTSVAFSARIPKEFDEEREQFDVPDFVVGTAKAYIVALQANVLDEQPGSKRRAGEVVTRGTHEAIESICAHPSKHLVATIGAGGLLQVYDFERKELKLERVFSGLKGSAVKYSPVGTRIACGFSNGTIKLISDGLEDVQNFRHTASTITELVFSSDGMNLAASDSGMCVGLLTYGHGKAGDKWEYVGKYRSHAAPITGLHFGIDGNGANRLFSVGMDCVLVEYDLQATSIAGGVKLRLTHPITSAASPLSIMFSPPLPPNGDAVLITSGEDYKIQLYDPESFNCQRTLLGPTFGGPVNRTLVFRDEATGKDYMAYGTEDRVAGLVRLPLGDDPSNNSIGLIAHSQRISSLAVSFDGTTLITAGGSDSVVNIWRIDAGAFEEYLGMKAAVHGPYAGLLEGGPDGAFVDEIRDYFFLSQIRSQGENTTSTRKVDGAVPLEELPSLMRALGFYPSHAEVQDMVYEICQPCIDAGTEPPCQVSFEQFLSLFINHRPVIPLGKFQLLDAFREIGREQGSGALPRDTLVQALLGEGEPMTEDELNGCLAALGGPSFGIQSLPPEMDAQTFAEEILGFEDFDSHPSQHVTC